MVEVAFPDMRGLLIYYGGTVPGVYSVVLRGGGGFFSHAKIIRDGSRILWCGGSVFFPLHARIVEEWAQESVFYSVLW